MEDGVLSSIRKKIDNNITEIEYRTDLTDDEKVEHIIKIFAVTCSGIALQPIPFADVFILTPLQGYMGTRIANIRGIKISEQEGSDIVKEMIALGGMGYLAQQTAIGIFKMIPGLGSLLSVPVVISLTYAIGKVMDAHFKSKSMGRTLPKSELQKIFKQAKREAEDKKDLIKSGKNSVTLDKVEYYEVSVEIQREYQNWLGSLSPEQRRNERRVNLDSSFSSWITSLKEV